MKQNEIEDLNSLFNDLKSLIAKSESNVNVLKSQVNDLVIRLENLQSCPEIRRDWIPQDEVKKYLQYGDTQMSAITQKYDITCTYIGKRKYFSTASLKKVFEANKTK